MRTPITLLFFAFIMVSCGQNKNYSGQASSEHYSNNEDKFGFVIFDSRKVDTFFKEYSPIEFNNPVLRNRFQSLITTDTGTNKSLDEFKKHTKEPTSSDYSLSLNVLKATNSDSGQMYFNPSLNYLFFFESLPDKFKNKWTQTQSGDFKFNVTFFNLIRTKCKTFDAHIYGSMGYWDESIRKVFKDDIFNEITSDKAQEIKHCITDEKAFGDLKLQPHKDNFILLLDSVIEKKWRLFLLDKN